MATDEITSTPLERTADALSAAVTAFAYPSDTLVRGIAIRNCSGIAVDYIACVAGALKAHESMTADAARWAVVDMLADEIHRLRAKGAETRRGILANGRPANAAGMPYDDGEDDEYGALA